MRKRSSWKKKWFKKKVIEKFVQVGSSQPIDVDIDVNGLKSEICKVLRATKPKAIKGWDGFVGDIPDDLKKAFIRSSKIGDLFSE